MYSNKTTEKFDKTDFDEIGCCFSTNDEVQQFCRLRYSTTIEPLSGWYILLKMLSKSFKIAKQVRGLSTKSAPSRNVVIVDGVRIPFTTGGSTYSNYLAVDLGRLALKGLLLKTAIDPKIIDYLFYGTVIQEAKTSNIAREAGMGAGIPVSVAAHTITQACISANQCVTTGAEKILAGKADIVRIYSIILFLVYYSVTNILLLLQTQMI